MTREEAIEVFKTEHPYNPERKDNDLHSLAKAFDMAISALSKNKGDLISRQAVLDELEKWDWQELYLPIHFKQILDDVPSVENKGEWIPITEGMELPEHDVICCDNEGNIALGYLYFDEEENQIACDRDPYVMFGVVAYMELPEPYKAESEDKE